MFKILLFTLIVAFSAFSYAQADRQAIAKELTAMAQEYAARFEFAVAPDDDTTLIMYYDTHLKASELTGDWTSYLFAFGSSPEELKDEGFTQIRIYTSRSKDVNDYVLKNL
jgi:hypothetical protein